MASRKLFKHLPGTFPAQQRQERKNKFNNKSGTNHQICHLPLTPHFYCLTAGPKLGPASNITA